MASVYKASGEAERRIVMNRVEAPARRRRSLRLWTIAAALLGGSLAGRSVLALLGPPSRPAAQSPAATQPVSIRTDMDNVETIAIVTESEVSPLAAVVRSPGRVRGYSTRIRVERSSSIAAFVKANGRLYAANTRIKITQGGYGITQ